MEKITRLPSISDLETVATTGRSYFERALSIAGKLLPGMITNLVTEPADPARSLHSDTPKHRAASIEAEAFSSSRYGGSIIHDGGRAVERRSNMDRRLVGDRRTEEGAIKLHRNGSQVRRKGSRRRIDDGSVMPS